MASRHTIPLYLALLCLGGLAAAVPNAGHAADSTTTPKAKKHVSGSTTTLGPETPSSTPAEQFAAPLQLDLDSVKALLLKPDPVVPYLPQVQASKPLPAPNATGDTPDQPHLAPLLRETSLPDSMGDRGSFMERHEFGIQLRDHF
jgi:hypothetical protein